MPSVLKRFMNPSANLYQFPDTAELVAEETPPASEALEERPVDSLPPEESPDQTPVPEGPIPPHSPAKTSIDFAAIQAEAILADARNQAQQLLEAARKDAEEELEQLRQDAREEGFSAGYSAGMANALTQAKEERATQAVQLGSEIGRFLEKATLAREEMLLQTQDELQELAIAVAEKVVKVSLKSSGEIVGRMIQGATEKMRRKEWVHIYIAGCDAKALAQVTPSLTASLSALSSQVRIVPMSEEESGTCIIEMPDEIIDASASTQLGNIRELLADLGGGERQ